MSYFSFATKNSEVTNIEEDKKKDKNPFIVIYALFGLINKSNKNWKDNLDNLFVGYEDGDFGFITWALNHYLVYNKFMRDNLVLFFTTHAFLKDRKYVYFFVEYCIKNNLKFPKFMKWYKADINNDPKRFLENFKSNSKLKDSDLQEFIDYMSSKGYSLRELNLNLEYI